MLDHNGTVVSIDRQQASGALDFTQSRTFNTPRLKRGEYIRIIASQSSGGDLNLFGTPLSFCDVRWVCD